jgi:uncharacterized protein (UPF0128 family)
MVRKNRLKKAEELIGAVDRRCDELMKDAQAHIAATLQELPEADRRVIFEAWAIQKIAGLQIIVETQNEAINELLRRAGLE